MDLREHLTLNPHPPSTKSTEVVISVGRFTFQSKAANDELVLRLMRFLLSTHPQVAYIQYFTLESMRVLSHLLHKCRE